MCLVCYIYVLKKFVLRYMFVNCFWAEKQKQTKKHDEAMSKVAASKIRDFKEQELMRKHVFFFLCLLLLLKGAHMYHFQYNRVAP